MKSDAPDSRIPPGYPQSRDATASFVPSAAEAQPPTVPASLPLTVVSPAVLRSFGPYDLLQEIDRGGMGVVYRAYDTRLKREVALKMMLTGHASGATEVERFQREARTGANLSHQNIITVFEADQIDGQLYFTMPLVNGGTLATHLRRFTTDRRACVVLVEKVARAVQHAHVNGVIHRDLKPANILLTENDEPLVADFGLAKRLDDRRHLTRSGPAPGTSWYMSPEGVDPRRGKIDERSDVWALGVMLYELLTGKRPFRGRREDVSQRILNEEPARPSRVRPGLPAELEAIVDKCLEKDPNQRYRSAEELANDLRAWLEGKKPSVALRGAFREIWRRFRRYVYSAAALLLLVGAITSAFVAAPYVKRPDLDWSHAETLIGPDREPKHWSKILDRAPEPTIGEGENQVFTLESNGFYPIALGEDRSFDNFRVEAEIQLSDKMDTEAGLILPVTIKGPTGKEHYFLKFGFMERPGGAFNSEGRVVNDLRRITDPREGRVSCDISALPLQRSFPRPAAGENTFHKIALEVRPDGTKLFWDKDNLGKIDPITLSDRVKELALDDLKLTFGRQGRTGIYVSNGKAAFRNIVIVPIR